MRQFVAWQLKYKYLYVTECSVADSVTVCIRIVSCEYIVAVSVHMSLYVRVCSLAFSFRLSASDSI